MAECTNPGCLCQGIKPMDNRKLSNHDLDNRFGTATSRLRLTLTDVRLLIDTGSLDPEVGSYVLADITRAIDRLDTEHRLAAETLGFTIRGGIGPGDWRTK
jgi:hypothetical protein